MARYAEAPEAAGAEADRLETIVECEPHALQRMMSVFPSSSRPMTCVRWLPHFSHGGGEGDFGSSGRP
jgi:hypothetical protein